ncbi:hypothetical protein DENSPDRAFT_934433 [Dentipellis sp. KUC8613]|nr:hypothetical protein DENSPDRAFT_934433 [Dentipellis sp. KUC8613]
MPQRRTSRHALFAPPWLRVPHDHRLAPWAPSGPLWRHLRLCSALTRARATATSAHVVLSLPNDAVSWPRVAASQSSAPSCAPARRISPPLAPSRAPVCRMPLPLATPRRRALFVPNPAPFACRGPSRGPFRLAPCPLRVLWAFLCPHRCLCAPFCRRRPARRTLSPSVSSSSPWARPVAFQLCAAAMRRSGTPPSQCHRLMPPCRCIVPGGALLHIRVPLSHILVLPSRRHIQHPLTRHCVCPCPCWPALSRAAPSLPVHHSVHPRVLSRGRSCAVSCAVYARASPFRALALAPSAPSYCAAAGRRHVPQRAPSCGPRPRAALARLRAPTAPSRATASPLPLRAFATHPTPLSCTPSAPSHALVAPPHPSAPPSRAQAAPSRAIALPPGALARRRLVVHSCARGAASLPSRALGSPSRAFTTSCPHAPSPARTSPLPPVRPRLTPARAVSCPLTPSRARPH